MFLKFLQIKEELVAHINQLCVGGSTFICLFVYIFNPLQRACLLMLEVEEGRERDTERNIDVQEKRRLVASHMGPDQGSNLLPRHVP